jgi:hypothetical protein
VRAESGGLAAEVAVEAKDRAEESSGEEAVDQLMFVHRP